ELLDAGGTLVSSNANVTRAIATTRAGGTLSGTTTVAAANGVATFGNLSIDKAGTGYTLAASSTGLTGATSSAFNILVGAATHLAFLQQPTNRSEERRVSTAVTVQLLAADNNQGSSTATATLAIGTTSAGGTLSGTSRVAAVNGVATFGNLSIDKAGTGYTLAASSTGLTGATSSAFNILVGAATHLAFLQQPTNTAATQTSDPPRTGQLRDAGNKPGSSSAD